MLQSAAAAEAGLVGRERELAAVDGVLDRLGAGAGGLLEVVGEPGIGKSRLLGALRGRVDVRGWLVLEGRALEFEQDLPYALWVDALDAYVASLPEQRLRRLGIESGGALAAVAPRALGGAVPDRSGDRHGVHAAVRGLLERLVAPQPVVVCLDDVHWGDDSSLDLVAALALRPPAGAVLMALAYREGQAPSRVVAALGRAAREGRTERLALAPLTETEAAVLLGTDVKRARMRALYAASGGNPFYLEQLARGWDAEGADGSVLDLGVPVPPAVAVALAGELDALSDEARTVLEAAAVVGDPFEPDVVAEAAGTDEGAALAAIDTLLARELVCPSEVPRRFRFRHPLVRHAVYAAAPGGWRLAAHARVAVALERRGASAVARAHHVEQAARRGDGQAIALLSAAAESVAHHAPASAARHYASALRLLPEGPALASRRGALLAAHGEALVMAGDLEAGRGAIADALPLLPGDDLARRWWLTAVCASIELWTGHVEAGRRRLHAALAEFPDEPSLARIGLLVTLGAYALFDLDLDRAAAIAVRALADADALAAPVERAVALSHRALAVAAAGRADQAARHCDEATAAFDRLDDRALMMHFGALHLLSWAETYVDRFDAALGHLKRGVAVARRTGHGYFLVPMLTAQVHPLEMLGRLSEAVAVGEQAVEAAWMSGNPQYQIWALGELAWARMWRGDMHGALREARECFELARSRPPNLMWAAAPGWSLGDCLVDTGDLDRGVETMLEAFGGIELPRVVPAERPYAWADLAGAELTRGHLDEAEQAIARAEHAARTTGTRVAAALARRTRAALLLAQGHAGEAATAAEHAVATRSTSRLETALAELTHGRALAAAGDRDRARAVLAEAADRFDAYGALRHRDAARQGLRRLGVRTWKAGPAVATQESGLAALTDRERELAALVANGKTNREIAAELYLSVKTVEAHLRNLYAKVGVRSRVELTRELERARA